MKTSGTPAIASPIPIRLDLTTDGSRGFLTTDEGRTGFFAQMHVNGKWHRVPLRAQGRVAGLPIDVAWRRRKIGDRWLSVQARLTNRGAAPLVLGSFHLIEGRNLPHPSADATVLVDSAGGWFAGAVRATGACPAYDEQWKLFIAEEDVAWFRQKLDGELKAGAHHSLAGMLAYHRGDGRPTWILGALVPLWRCTTMPFLVVDPRTGAVRAFAVANDFAGYELRPGERVDTETALVGCFTDPHAGLEDWAATCARDRKVACWPKPPVGWCSWYGYRLTQNATDTLRTADLIRRKLDGLGFRYIQIDLGYNRDNLPGDWFETNEHYPRGLADLSRRLRKRKFALGVWACPFVVAADSAFAREHPEALVKDARGRPYDFGRWYWEPHCSLNMPDPTHPEGVAFLRRMVRHFKGQGVRYFKFDFTNRLGVTERTFVLHDRRKIKGIEVYRHGLKIIHDALDEDDYVYWCSNLLHFGIGLGDTSMTACDIGNTGFHLGRKIEGRTENVAFFRQQATTTMSRYYLHNRLLLLNADALNVAPPADIEECRLRATLVAMSGGQVFLGDRFDLCKEDRFDLIRQVLPPYGKAARPVDLFERVYPGGHPQIWHLNVDTGWDQRDVVALVNLDRPKRMTVPLARLGRPVGTRYHLWEFWTQRYLGLADQAFSLELKFPSTRLVALVTERRHPWVLSTTFHVTQGGVELAQVEWDEKRRILRGGLRRPRGTRGDLILTVPPPYRCALPRVARGVHRYALVAGSGETKWSVSFRTG